MAEGEGRNTAFVFIKPHASGVPGVRQVLVEALDASSIRIERSGETASEEIERGGLIDKHYATIAKYAIEIRPSKLPASVIDNGLTAFASTFGRSWGDALQANVILNASEAMAKRGLTAQELLLEWNAADKKLKLGPGLYVGRLREKDALDIYVINGFYPANREKFTAPGKSIHWYVVSWNEADLSWKDFRAKIIGATNPADAEEGSLRKLLFANYQAVGLPTAPNTSDNCIHASASPVEAARERHIWLQQPVEVDPLTLLAIAAGVQMSTIAAVLDNSVLSNIPQLGSGPAFDLLEDHQTSQTVEDLKTIEAALRRESSTNVAFLFLRPRMATHLARSAVEALLSARSVDIIREGDMTSEHIAASGIVDKHYSTIARYANVVRPVQLRLTEESKRIFEDKFGTRWESCIKANKILNAADAAKDLGCITAKELWVLWSAHDRRAKLAPGLFVTYFDEQDLYIVNGFFPLLHEQLCVPNRSIHWFVVSFYEKDLTWAQFRRDVVGDRDPLQAAEGSIRRMLYANWKQLGLLEMPSAADNGLHASGSALEAVAERHIWLNTRVDADPTAQACRANGATSAMLHVWLSNPVIELDGQTAAAFDLLQDVGTMQLIDTLRKCDADNRSRQVNRAFVFVKPHAVTHQTLSLVSRTFPEHHITIEREGDISSEEIERLQLIDKHYCTIARYAMSLAPQRLVLSPKGRDTFHKTFGIHWETAVVEGKVFNAAESLVQLGHITADQLRLRWQSAHKAKLGPGLYAGRVEALDMFVINGFYPANREKFTAPGKSIHWYVVSWNEADLSWKDFRAKIIGATNPADAEEGSLRNIVFKDWRKLQLSDVPNVSDNGIHASASPLEGLAERCIWLSRTPVEDEFGVSALCGGADAAILRSLLDNPTVDGDSVFDVVEDMQSSAAIPRIVAMSSRIRADLRRNSAFVFIKPQGLTEKTKPLVRSVLETGGMRIDSEGSISCEHIFENNLIDKHYASTAQFALQVKPAQLLVPNDGQVRFELEFGFAWTAAVSSAQVLNAAEAESKFGADYAARKWVSAHRRVKLTQGLYVARFDEDNVFVINGFYPAIRQRYVQTGKQLHWYVVSWNEADLSWKDFRAKIIGETNPEVAAIGSIRRTVLDSWQALGLISRPDIADNIVHASASPLEGIAERRLWLEHGNIPELDVFGFTLRLAGVSDLFLERLLENPTIELGGRAGPAFDLLEDFDSSSVAAVILDMQARQSVPPPAPYLIASPSQLPSPVTTFAPRNFAFMFVKPHAMTAGVLALMDVMLREHQIRIDMEGEMVGLEIAQRGIFDRHYSVLYNYAEVQTPEQIEVTEDAQSTFKEKFGITWLSAVQGRLVFNAIGAMEHLNVSPSVLGELWASSTSRLRLMPGVYITRFAQNDIYVVNGFYPANKEKYIRPDVKVHWYVVSWNERDLSWRDFRAKLVGPTNPAEAPLDSIRGTIFAEWKGLHLVSRPNTADNGIHASAGPIEALAERLIWLDSKLQEDPFAKMAIQRGSSSITISHWLRNPHVRIQGSREGLVFDLFEDNNSLEAINALVAAEEARCRFPARNSAFVFVKPHAINRYVFALIDAAFHENKIVVERSGDIASEAIAKKRLIDQHYSTIARYALGCTADHIHIDAAGDARFRSAFGVSWNDAVAGGIVLNAKEAAAQLGNLSPDALLQQWNERLNKVKIAPGLYVAEFLQEGFYVINGFYPANREKFTAPGKSIHWYVVSWNEADLSWKDFRAKIIGATNPADATAGSLRNSIYRQWESIHLPLQPNVSDNAIHASAGPFEGLVERFVWLGASRLEEDSLGQSLLANGADPELVTEWMKTNPPIPLYGRVAPVFDQLEDLQTTDVIAVVQDFTDRRVVAARAERKAKLASEVVTIEDAPKNVRSLALVDEAIRLKGINVAFVMIKPHAVTPRIAELLEASFTANGLHVEEKGEIRSELIEQDKLIDKQFPRVARHALEVKPEELALTNDVKMQFLATYQVNWDSLIRDGGKIYNAVDAALSLGHLTALQLAKRWNAYANPPLELGPGIFVKYFEGDDVFVINGFYLLLREKYFAPEKVVRWYIVSWDERALAWTDFLAKLIGAPNPASAQEGSIRANIAKNWRALGLAEALTETDNAIHASASPLEALGERVNWIGQQIDNDLFGRALILGGCSVPLVRDWLANPVVSIGLASGLAFDLVSGKQASEVVNILSDATAEEYFTPMKANVSPTPKRRIFSAAIADKFINATTEASLKDFFLMYDPKDTGYIDRNEFRRDFVRMEDYGCPLAPRVVERLFTQHDRLKDGRMDFEEFSIIVIARQRL